MRSPPEFFDRGPPPAGGWLDRRERVPAEEFDLYATTAQLMSRQQAQRQQQTQHMMAQQQQTQHMMAAQQMQQSSSSSSSSSSSRCSSTSRCSRRRCNANSRPTRAGATAAASVDATGGVGGAGYNALYNRPLSGRRSAAAAWWRWRRRRRWRWWWRRRRRWRGSGRGGGAELATAHRAEGGVRHWWRRLGARLRGGGPRRCRLQPAGRTAAKRRREPLRGLATTTTTAAGRLGSARPHHAALRRRRLPHGSSSIASRRSLPALLPPPRPIRLRRRHPQGRATSCALCDARGDRPERPRDGAERAADGWPPRASRASTRAPTSSRCSPEAPAARAFAQSSTSPRTACATRRRIWRVCRAEALRRANGLRSLDFSARLLRLTELHADKNGRARCPHPCGSARLKHVSLCANRLSNSPLSRCHPRVVAWPRARASSRLSSTLTLARTVLRRCRSGFAHASARCTCSRMASASCPCPSSRH